MHTHTHTNKLHFLSLQRWDCFGFIKFFQEGKVRHSTEDADAVKKKVKYPNEFWRHVMKADGQFAAAVTTLQMTSQGCQLTIV